MAQLEGVIEGGAVINVEIIGTGPQGRDGYTPIKGVDYFTPSEVASIESNAAQMAAAAASRDIAAETARAMEAEDNRIKKFYTNNLGSVSVADSDDGAVRNLVIGGKSEQGADPSPGNPQEIKSVENCTMTVSNADGSNAQTVPIPFVLRGIGDVRDELYVYADGSGKLIQRIGLETFDDTSNWRREVLSYGINFYCPRKTLSSNLKGPLKYLINVGRSSYFLQNKGDSYITQNLNLFWLDDVSLDYFKDYAKSNKITVIGPLENPIETSLTSEQVKALFDLRTHYGGTNISFDTDNGVEPVVNFDYACALENFVSYIKAAQGDDRKFIYDMADRMTDAEYVAALAYVNSEYAAAITELEV